MKKIRVAINGFGRIGRVFLRQALGRYDTEVVAINDPFMSIEEAADKFEHDSVYRKYPKQVYVSHSDKYGDILGVPDHGSIIKFSEKDPGRLAWKDLGIDIVVEASGVFTKSYDLIPHLEAGAKRVVITAPTNDPEIPMATPNIVPDWKALKESQITSNASCTTNAAAPIIKILSETYGVESAMLITTHAYTNGQGLVDGPGKKGDPLRGRAAALNIIPTSTGAAEAIGVLIPGLKEKFTGISARVPVPAGSLVYLVVVPSKDYFSIDGVNETIRRFAQKDEWRGIVGVIEKPVASTDILGSEYGSLFDTNQTRTLEKRSGKQIMVAAWYDNEWGYCSMLIKHIQMVSKFLE